MSDKKQRFPILGSGEEYISPIKKGNPGVPPSYPRSFEEARELVLNDLSATSAAIESLPENSYLSEGVVFCIRLNQKFIAKSYHPAQFLDRTPLNFLGSMPWASRNSAEGRANRVESKLLFVRSHKDDIGIVEDLINSRESALDKGFKDDLRKIDKISLLDISERLHGFDDWQSGITEFIIHPLDGLAEKALKICRSRFRDLNVEESKIKVASYAKGLHFISAKINRAQLSALEEINFFRSITPLGEIDIPDLREASTEAGPQPAPSATRSTIKVGIFDGGADSTMPLLLNHCKDHQISTVKATEQSRAHGTAVAGCVLYGDLSGYGPTSTVPPPSVSVESFQVLPRANATDPELYDVIDNIEKIVKSREDIKVFNISFGPQKPISDSTITRFTFALDQLAYTHKVLFIVAVGNDGHKDHPDHRVQPPSDLINGLGVGSYTFKRSGTRTIQAPWESSSTGPGREGCKVKPDLVAFGGSSSFPIGLVSTHANKVRFSCGTSYAAPIVSGMAGELLGRCDRMSALSARVLLVNASKRGIEDPSLDYGHGFLERNVEDVMSCTENNITILYKGAIRPGKYAKVEIPFLENDGLTGKVTFRWTIGILTPPDISNLGEYSGCSIEDTFYSNTKKFKFNHKYTDSNGRLKIETRSLDLRYEEQEKQTLLAAGWAQNKWPVPTSGGGFRIAELARRNLLKWDTIVDRQKSLQAKSVFKPFFILHSLARNESSELIDSIEFSVAVNISYPTYKGNLYSEIKEIYNKLEAIEMRSLNQVIVRV